MRLFYHSFSQMKRAITEKGNRPEAGLFHRGGDKNRLLSGGCEEGNGRGASQRVGSQHGKGNGLHVQGLEGNFIAALGLESEGEAGLGGGADAKVVDPDYMMFKLKEKGALELDDNGKIKGIDDKIAGLKTQFPTQFESGSGAGSHVEEKKLPPDGSNGGGQGMTKAEFLKKPYAERAKFYQDNPEGYKQIMNG